MEIAHGDYGEMVNKLVVAVQNGKCNNWMGPKVAANDVELGKIIDKNATQGTFAYICIISGFR